MLIGTEYALAKGVDGFTSAPASLPAARVGCGAKPHGLGGRQAAKPRFCPLWGRGVKEATRYEPDLRGEIL